MMKTPAYAVNAPGEELRPTVIERREPGPREVAIEILYCGVCHSDIHHARGEWGSDTPFPLVPGHEIVGRVVAVGSDARKFRVGDLAGVGCMVGSCGSCNECRDDNEQFCERHTSWTYGGTEQDQKTPTQGGYSGHIVLDQEFALRVSDRLPLEGVAPLLCAGVTTYAPLRRFRVRRGTRVGVVGLGGLGHMAVKLAAAMDAEVTVFSTSPSKEQDALKLGAQRFVVSREPGALEALAGTLDLVIDTVSAAHDLDPYLATLRRDGALVLLGLPEKPLHFDAYNVVNRQRVLTGSNIGGLRITQEMLDFCAEKDIVADVEVIPADRLNEAYDRTVKGDVKFRFVLDAKTLGA